MIYMQFRVSPADYRRLFWPKKCADHRTIGNRVGGSIRAGRGRGTGDLGTREAGDLRARVGGVPRQGLPA
jgi:hypothetical protein